MKKLTIALVVVLLSVSLLAACTPGVIMDWIANIGGGSATSGNAASYGNTLPFVSFGGAEYATFGNAATMGNATPGNVVTMGNASSGNAAADSPAGVQPLLPTPTPKP